MTLCKNSAIVILTIGFVLAGFIGAFYLLAGVAGAIGAASVIGIIALTITFKQLSAYREKKAKEGNSNDKTSWKKAKPFIIIIICIGIFILLFTMCTIDSNNRKHKYDDVFEKAHNTWTEDEKEYVNDFYEWESEQQKKNK